MQEETEPENPLESDLLGLNPVELFDGESAVLRVSMIDGEICIDFTRTNDKDLESIVNICLSEVGKKIISEQSLFDIGKKRCIHPMDVFGPKINLGDI